MSPKILLRTAAVSLIAIVIPHTSTLFITKVRDAQEQALLDSMKSYTFNMMGSIRSHADFYTGYSAVLSIMLLTIALVAWLLSNTPVPQLKALRPIVAVLTFGVAGLMALCWTNFFIAPAAMSTVSALAFAAATLQLGKKA